MGDLIKLNVGGGSMQAYVARPVGEGKYPGVIVFQEAFGVNNHIRNVTDRIAAEGYVAIAPELFHRSAPAGFESGYSDFSLVQAHMQAITTEGLAEDAKAAFAWLQQSGMVIDDHIGCIGFCLGGKTSFIANALLPLKASVSFYGGGMHTVREMAASLSAPQLLFWGGKDKHIKPEHIGAVIESLKGHHKEYINIEISYGDHGFFCDERAAFHPAAAGEAWAIVKQFFRNKIG